MIRRPALLVLVALAGCGGAGSEQPAATPIHLDPRRYGPAHSDPGGHTGIPRPSPQPVSGALARRLDAGTIGVVDVVGRVAIRPRTLETAKDGLVEDLSWSRWGGDGATGTGRLDMLSCSPNCAVGQKKRVPARVTLSGVRQCADGRRYFDAAEVRIDPASSPADGAQPASYVRAPC